MKEEEPTKEDLINRWKNAFNFTTNLLLNLLLTKTKKPFPNIFVGKELSEKENELINDAIKGSLEEIEETFSLVKQEIRKSSDKKIEEIDNFLKKAKVYFDLYLGDKKLYHKIFQLFRSAKNN